MSNDETLLMERQQLQAKTDARRRQKEACERSGHPGLTSYEAWYAV
jgi:hypothetical protein